MIFQRKADLESRRKYQGRKDLLVVTKCILQNCRKIKKTLSMAWVDYKKVYDMVSQSWFMATMGMIGLTDNITGLIHRSYLFTINKWRTNLHASGKLLRSVLINRGIFQCDSFSPLQIVIALLSLTHILRETKMGYQLEKMKQKLISISSWKTQNCMETTTKKQTS